VEIYRHHRDLGLSDELDGGLFPGPVHNQFIVFIGRDFPGRENPQRMPFLQVGKRTFKAGYAAFGILMGFKGVYGHNIGCQRGDPVQQEIGNYLKIGPGLQQQF